MTDPTPKPLAPLVTVKPAEISTGNWLAVTTPLIGYDLVFNTEGEAKFVAVAISHILEASRAKDHDLMREKDEQMATLAAAALDVLTLADTLMDRLHARVDALPPSEPQCFIRLRALLTSLTERINTH